MHGDMCGDAEVPQGAKGGGSGRPGHRIRGVPAGGRERRDGAEASGKGRSTTATALYEPPNATNLD